MMFALTALASLMTQAYAQQATPAALPSVEITGYRGSLETTTKDKREAVGFQDSIFAEDLGKFPDTNIAESINRIPGIQISREITGEGINIQIRGLGTSFTKILLNGAPVAVASTGRTDSQNTNREVDLDLLPTDLFKRVTVNKSPTAGMLEGGAAGNVDMRSARPFDNPGEYFAYSAQGTNSKSAGNWGNKGSILGSKTGGEFGILGGLAWSNSKVRTTGFETIGWTNANLSATQSTSATRNSTGGGNWTIPGTVPANAGSGLVAGTAVDQAFLLANNPGLNITQIDNGIIPRLGRTMDESGTKDKLTGIVSMEYRPSDALQFYVDAMASKKKNQLTRVDMNWVGRNGAMVPINMQVDSADCAQGCVVTKGTFTNAQWFLEFRPYTEDVTLFGINPGMEWKIDKNLKLDAQINWTKSSFHRDSPTVGPVTPLGNGTTVTYDNTSGGIPSITSNTDVNNPASFGWNGGRVNQQEELRDTETKGVRANLTWGDKSLNLKAGFALDDVSRNIRSKDNSGAWQSAVCGNNPSVVVPGNGNLPGCTGANTPGVSYASVYPGFGTGATAGRTDALIYNGSLVPNAALANYLTPGSSGFVTVDWNKFRADTKYQSFSDAALDTNGSSNTGAGAGSIQEKTRGIYLEVNGIAMPMDYQLRYNAGVRYVQTDQIVGAFGVSTADPRNATLQNGGLYPSITPFNYVSTSYDNVLPSLTAALNVTKDVIARAAVSRSMTRANPDSLRPTLNFSSPSADVGSVGNSALKPYISDNIDVGLDWYTGREGYLSATFFQKKINGFTVNENVTQPFSSLAAYGVTYDTLTQGQKDAINTRGGPGAATVVLTRPRNADGILAIQGTELGWVQPLDKWLPVKGFGFSANVTFTDQSASGEGTNGFIALGVPKMTNNVTAYYQRDGYMLRLSRTFNEGSQVANANQNGIGLAALYGDAYQQLDLSTSFDLERILEKKNWPTLTFDVINLGDATQRSYFQFTNATFTQYKPGPTYVVGLRAKF
ncbi:MAG: TonB-dependent receptor [Comamonadaceae bacterium PBBC2]|nr:MAG: TonB-dependent receptor [Comamonadaceae bacterium PBBC2]